MMNDAFYFLLKTLFVLKILKFLSYLMWKSGSRRKLWLIAKFMTSQTGEQIITMYILPDISISKVNQILKFGQLIDYNIRNIFLEKSYKTWWRS